MPKQWVKQELRKNEVARATEKAAGWLLTHRDLALGIGGTVLAAVCVGLFAVSRYRDLRNTAWERLAFAESYAASGQTKTADDQLKTLAQQFPRAPAAAFGQLFDGDVLYGGGDYQGAIAAYQKVLERQDPALAPFATAGIAIAQEASGQCQAAYDTTQRFMGLYQDHYLAPQVHAIMARCLKTLGRTEEAEAALKKIALLYPETAWAQWANSVLQPPAPAKAAAAKPSIPPLLARPAAPPPMAAAMRPAHAAKPAQAPSSPPAAAPTTPPAQAQPTAPAPSDPPTAPAATH